MSIVSLVQALLILPVIAIAVEALLHVVAPRITKYVAWLFAGACWIVALMLCFEYFTTVFPKAAIVTLATLPAPFNMLNLLIDGISAVIVAVLFTVFFAAMLFAPGYLEEEDVSRYCVLKFWFVDAVALIILSENILLTILAWELMSFASALLIAYHYKSVFTCKAAILEIVTVKIADIALYIGLALLWGATGTFDYLGIARYISAHGITPVIAIALALIVIGSMGDSVQFPFMIWLPPACVAAPATVCALLHSTTVVKAGVYLSLRMMSLAMLYGGVPASAVMLPLMICLVMGLITTVISNVYVAVNIGKRVRHIKEVLAYSTIAHVAILYVILGFAAFVGFRTALSVWLIYFVAHAFAKSTLFLVAGALHHGVHTYDITQIRGLWRIMPYTALAMSIAFLSMMGSPPMLGFVAELSLFAETLVVLPIFLLLIVCLTIKWLIMAKVMYMTLPGEAEHKHELPPLMLAAEYLLVALVVGLGILELATGAIGGIATAMSATTTIL